MGKRFTLTHTHQQAARDKAQSSLARQEPSLNSTSQLYIWRPGLRGGLRAVLLS